MLGNTCWKASCGAWQRVKLLSLCGGRPYCPWSSFWVLLRQRDRWQCSHLKSQQNSPVYFFKDLNAGLVAWVSRLCLLCHVCVAKSHALIFTNVRCVPQPAFSSHVSLSCKGTSLVRNWRLILELQSSWLLKWWTMTLFPSQQTCGV